MGKYLETLKAELDKQLKHVELEDDVLIFGISSDDFKFKFMIVESSLCLTVFVSLHGDAMLIRPEALERVALFLGYVNDACNCGGFAIDPLDDNRVEWRASISLGLAPEELMDAFRHTLVACLSSHQVWAQMIKLVEDGEDPRKTWMAVRYRMMVKSPRLFEARLEGLDADTLRRVQDKLKKDKESSDSSEGWEYGGVPDQGPDADPEQ